MRLLAIAMILCCATGVASAQSRQQIWDFWQHDDGTATALDCRDCPEDESIRISCGPGAPGVKLTILSVLVPEGLDTGAALSLVFATGGQEFRRAGVVEFSEFFGAMPVAVVPPEDPILDAIAAGAVLSVSLGQSRSEIPLTGSGAALGKLQAACAGAN